MGHADYHAAPLIAAIAREIRDILELLESIADTLVADEGLVMAHLGQLQSFDLVIQRSEECAAVLDRLASGSSALDAIKPVRLTVVQDMLGAALTARGTHNGAG